MNTKQLPIAFALLCAIPCFGQMAPLSIPPVDTVSTINGVTNLRRTVGAVLVSVCQHPAAKFAGCAKVAVCKDSAGVDCSTAYNPIAADSYGNVSDKDATFTSGKWILPGTYDYWITADGTNNGPYVVNASPAGNGVFNDLKIGEFTFPDWIAANLPEWTGYPATATLKVIAPTANGPSIAALINTQGHGGDGIGISAHCFSDSTSPVRSCWGVYGEAIASPGANPAPMGILASEFDVVEKNNIDDSQTPYRFPVSPGNHTAAVWAASGGDHANVYDASIGFGTVNNGAKFHHGLMFKNGSITNDNVSGSILTNNVADAIALAKNHCIDWYEPTYGTIAASLCSFANDASGVMSAGFYSHYFSLFDNSGTRSLLLYPNNPAGGGAPNALAQAGDSVLLANSSGADHGALTLGNWSGSTKGARMNAAGAWGFGVNPMSSSNGDVKIGGKLNVGGNDISNAPRMTVTCPVLVVGPGANSWCNFTPTKNVVVESVDVKSQTVPSCATSPIFGMDGTAATVTFGNGIKAVVANSLSVALTAGTTYGIGVTNADDCTTQPANVMIIVQYRMQ